MVKHKRADYQYALIVSVLDCTGCASCANVCPTKSLTMQPIASELDRQKIYDALVDTSEKPELLTNNTIGVQYRKPYLEFSGACARLRRDSVCQAGHPAVRRPYVHCQRHRLLLHLGRFRTLYALHGRQERPRPRLVQLSV